MHTPGDPRNTYLASLQWTRRLARLLIQQLNRLQNTNDLLVADARSGRRAARLPRHRVRRGSTSVDDVVRLDGRVRPSTWTSEKDGWRHLYRVALDGSGDRLLTKFDGDVIDVVSIDVDGGWAYFIASPASATERFLYRARLDGSGARRAGDAGRRSAARTPTGSRRTAAGRFTRFRAPTCRRAWSWSACPTTAVVRDARRQRRAGRAAWRRSVTPPTEFFTVDIGGGVVLDGSMIKPRRSIRRRKYPVIVYVYGEPAGQTVVDRWGGSRGAVPSRARRTKATSSRASTTAARRRRKARRGGRSCTARSAICPRRSRRPPSARSRRAHPFIDRDRIGVWGWSGGGSNTLNAMFRFPDVFKVGVSVAPVPDQRLYDTIYQERYMGLPQDNAEGYRVGSPINFAEGLKGQAARRPRIRRRQRPLPGHRAAGEPPGRAGQAVRPDGLPEPHARDLGGPGHEPARPLAHRALLPRSPAAGPEGRLRGGSLIPALG